MAQHRLSFEKSDFKEIVYIWILAENLTYGDSTVENHGKDFILPHSFHCILQKKMKMIFELRIILFLNLFTLVL